MERGKPNHSEKNEAPGSSWKTFRNWIGRSIIGNKSNITTVESVALGTQQISTQQENIFESQNLVEEVDDKNKISTIEENPLQGKEGLRSWLEALSQEQIQLRLSYGKTGWTIDSDELHLIENSLLTEEEIMIAENYIDNYFLPAGQRKVSTDFNSKKFKEILFKLGFYELDKIYPPENSEIEVNTEKIKSFNIYDLIDTNFEDAVKKINIVAPEGLIYLFRGILGEWEPPYLSNNELGLLSKRLSRIISIAIESQGKVSREQRRLVSILSMIVRAQEYDQWFSDSLLAVLPYARSNERPGKIIRLLVTREDIAPFYSVKSQATGNLTASNFCLPRDWFVKS